MRAISVLGVAAAIVLVAPGCARAPPAPTPEQPKAETPPPAPVPQPPPAAPAQPAAEPRKLPAVQTASIYFDYDSSELKPESRPLLQSFYDAVQARPDLHVRIEGNCDERGSREYNIALGQRRAEVARRYLVNLGLNGSRITAISNGKEKPRALGHDEDSWRQNRRDDLIPRSDTLGMSSPR